MSRWCFDVLCLLMVLLIGGRGSFQSGNCSNRLFVFSDSHHVTFHSVVHRPPCPFPVKQPHLARRRTHPGHLRTGLMYCLQYEHINTFIWQRGYSCIWTHHVLCTVCRAKKIQLVPFISLLKIYIALVQCPLEWPLGGFCPGHKELRIKSLFYFNQACKSHSRYANKCITRFKKIHKFCSSYTDKKYTAWRWGEPTYL